MAKIDHTNCSHPRTPKGRAACRAGRATFNPETGVLDMGTAAPKVRMLSAEELGLDMSGSDISRTALAEDQVKARNAEERAARLTARMQALVAARS